jgi:hypothetical protein
VPDFSTNQTERVKMNIRLKLELAVDRLNALRGFPAQEYHPEKPLIWQVGEFQVEGAYGGLKLVSIANTSGATTDVFSVGFVSARALLDLVMAYRAGFEEAGK